MTGHGASPLHDFNSSNSEYASPSSQTVESASQETQCTIRAPEHGHAVAASGSDQVQGEGRHQGTSCTLDAPSQPAWFQPIRPKCPHTSTAQWLRETDRKTFKIPEEGLSKSRKKKSRNSARKANNSQLSGAPQVIEPPAASSGPVNPFKVNDPGSATALPSLHAFMDAQREKARSLQEPQLTTQTVHSLEDSTPLELSYDEESRHADAPVSGASS